MTERLFKFSKINHTEEMGFDRTLTEFNALGVSGTIRENIQNSLDAKKKGSAHPVHVDIAVQRVDYQILPGIQEVFQHIYALEAGNDYTRNYIQQMQAEMVEKEPLVLVMEDSYTTGLSGAPKGKSDNHKDTFGVYAYEKGTHATSDQRSEEASRGGSHGVGKISNNAASKINLNYFSNNDGMGNQHIGGRLHLIDHYLEDQAYRGTGYLTDSEPMADGKDHYFPYPTRKFHPIFAKSTQGLKTITPYVSEAFNDIKNIVCAVCDNFFLAILENKLTARVHIGQRTELINKQTLVDLVCNPSYYPTETAEMKDVFTPLYVDTYLNYEPQSLPIEVNVRDFEEVFNFKLYFNYDPQIPTGRVGVIRSMGMKIVDHKVKNKVRQPFNAVLVGGRKEDDFLRNLENQSHTEISNKELPEGPLKRAATRFINRLNSALGEIIEEEFLILNPPTGHIDTSDLFYEQTFSIEDSLRPRRKKVVSNLADGIVKEKATSSQKGGVDETKDGQAAGRTEQTAQAPKPAGDRLRKPKPKQGQLSDLVDGRVQLYGHEVERVSVGPVEHFLFKLKDMADYQRVTINFYIADGDGRIHKQSDLLDLKRQYSQALGTADRAEYAIEGHSILEVPIVDSAIRLTLTKAPHINDYLKYSYEIEVSDYDL